MFSKAQQFSRILLYVAGPVGSSRSSNATLIHSRRSRLGHTCLDHVLMFYHSPPTSRSCIFTGEHLSSSRAKHCAPNERATPSEYMVPDGLAVRPLNFGIGSSQAGFGDR
jgi:hypothetical protein